MMRDGIQCNVVLAICGLVTRVVLGQRLVADDDLLEAASNGTTICDDCNDSVEAVPNGNAFSLRTEIWVIPLLVLSSINIVMILMFELYVAAKTFGTVPNKRHLFLGQTLLFGLFLSSAMGFIFSMEPHDVTCAIIRLVLGLSYTVVFVTLLVKLVFLISLNSGVYLPANYQGLLICFGIGIQLAIGIQWLVQQPPRVVLLNDEPICQTRFEELILALIYNILLLLTVLVLSIKCRSIRDNHREATFIGISIGFTVAIWVAWLVSSMVLKKDFRDACIAFGVVSNATITFLVMFLPKRRQLAAMGEEGMYLEDAGSRLSNHSSAMAPSFFHITPQTHALKPTHKSEKTIKTTKQALYDRMMYAPPAATPGRLLRYTYPSHVAPVFDYFEQPTATDLYYHQQHQPSSSSNHLFDQRTRMTSHNPNVHFYRSRVY